MNISVPPPPRFSGLFRIIGDQTTTNRIYTSIERRISSEGDPNVPKADVLARYEKYHFGTSYPTTYIGTGRVHANLVKQWSNKSYAYQAANTEEFNKTFLNAAISLTQEEQVDGLELNLKA